jgi:hypothetical protein
VLGAALVLACLLVLALRRRPRGVHELAVAPSAAPTAAPPRDSCLRVARRAPDDALRWSAIDVSIDLARCRIDVAQAAAGDRLENLLSPQALAAVNGGYFEADYRPTGWLRARGVDLAPVHRTRAGGVLAVRAGRAFVGPLAEMPFDPDFALQSAPLIVETDGAIGIHSDDGKRAARTVVCARGAELRFVVVVAPSGDGPTLFELARWLSGGGECAAALNLDGGPSTGVVFAPWLGEPSSAPRAPIGYALVVSP